LPRAVANGLSANIVRKLERCGPAFDKINGN
jgi:hypothetical protein